MKRRGITLVEVLVLVVVILGVLAFIASGLPTAREAARRAQCVSNLRMLGIALHNYLDANKHFPQPSQLVEGKRKIVGGYSFIAETLPYMEYQAIYDSLPHDESVDPLTSQDPNVVKLRKTILKELTCPSNFNVSRNNDGFSLTNYKAMCATSAESLRICVNPQLPTPYGDSEKHPDGAWAPGKPLRISEFTDGTSHTLLIAETMDDTNSVWIAGSDMQLVGMPLAKNYTKGQSEEFWAPYDFNGKYDSEAVKDIQNARTYLAFDFAGKDKGAYPDSAGRRPTYGPSSTHPTTVNHSFADASVRSISKTVDYAAYFFAITRNNGDPSPEI